MNYMVDIGMSKTWISLVWLAGPLSGLLVQPIVGALSDACQSPYGRRRPFLAFGAAVTVVCLFMTAWVRDISYAIFPEDFAHSLTIAFVVVAVFLLDFAVNVVQASGRALIVDSLPTDEQETGNAYASKLVATGHLVGYLMGYVDLRSVFFFLGDSQFKIVVFLACAALIVAIAVTCRSVEERVLVDRGFSKGQSVIGILVSIKNVFKTISTKTKLICLVQVLSWHAWFPFLFYSSTWVGEVYAKEQNDPTIDVDTRSRMGSFALLLFSIVTLICSFALPRYAVAKTPEEASRFPTGGRPSLSQLWGIAQIVFAIAMCSAVLVKSLVAAFFVIAMCGFSWSLTTWAPFTLIGEEITRSANKSRRNSNMNTRNGTVYTIVQSNEDLDDIEDNAPLTKHAVPMQNDDAGSVLGIHNIAICIPQFVISFISSIVFRLLDDNEGEHNAIGVVMAIGGLFALSSAVMIFKKLK